MDKKLLSFIFLCLFSLNSFSQCMLAPVPMQERIQNASLVIEGKITEQHCEWDAAHKLIYTIHTVTPYKLFKGILPAEIKIATLGGTLGNARLDVSNETVLQKGDKGIFCLEARNGIFQIYAAAQGFFRYLDANHASDVFRTYRIDPVLYKNIVQITKRNFVEIQKEDAPGAHTSIAPVIDNFFPDSLRAGTYDELTIEGSGFGMARATGFVEFASANDGGVSFIKPDSTEYLEWNDTLIRLRVPTFASTGNIRVYNGSDTATSSDVIFIKYSYLNVSYDDIRWQPVLIGKDANDGYEWHFNNKDFDAHPGSRTSFLRAFQSWRCGTLIRWDIGSNTSIDSIGQDGLCVIRFDSAQQLPSGVLGRCYSFYLGCFKGGGSMEWYVAELDIEFNDDFSWYYGTGTPGFSEYDFESVAVHELGHGQQLGHVNSTSEIMHYSIGNGQSKRNLSSRDLEGGKFVMNKSVAASVCNRDKINPLMSSFCSLIPVSGFTQSKLSYCPQEGVVFTDTSKGSTTGFSWDFGADANPPTANSRGPHVVTYSSSGIKTVKLVVEGEAGKDSISKPVTINPAKPSMAGIDILGDDTICKGKYDFRVPPVTDALAYFWYLNTGGSMTNNDTIGSVDMSLIGGPFRVWLYSQNLCGRSDTIEKFFHVRDLAKSGFTYAIHDDTILLSNTSTGADSYTWKFGNNQSSPVKDLSLTVPGSGIYPVRLIAESKCGKDSTEESIEVVMAGISPALKNKLYIYPNPSRDEINLQLISLREVRYTIFDATGKALQSGALRHPYRMNVASLSPGLYFIEVQAEDVSYRGRFIRE